MAPSLKRSYAAEFGVKNRMLAVRFGGFPAEHRPPPASFLAYRVEVSEGLSTPFRAVVHGVTPWMWRYPYDRAPGDRDREPHPDRFLGLPTSITIRATERGRTLHGVVTAARRIGEWHSVDNSEGYYAVELVVEAPLRLLDLRRASRLFQERHTLQILHELLNEHRFCNGVVGETLRAAFPIDSLPRSVRACRTQYQESDLDFIQRLLADEGLNYLLEAEIGDEGGLSNAWHVFGADHPFGTEPDTTLSITPRPDELALLDWHGRRRLAPAYTSAISHDYRDGIPHQGLARGIANDGIGEFARGSFGSYESLPPRAVRDPATDMDTVARRRQWAHDLDAEVYEGRTTAPLALARPVRILGVDSDLLPLHGDHDDDLFVVTAQTIVAMAAVPGELRAGWASMAEQVRRNAGVELFPPEDSDGRPPLDVRFTAQPLGKPLVPGHPSHARRPLPGPMTATVAGRAGQTVATDELGRIAVKFHWERAPDVPQFAGNFPQFESPPVRIRYAHPGAGNGVGLQYLPRVGDEVLILFIDNDPDRPIAVGSVHNGHMGTPAFGGVASLPGDAALTGLRTGEHQGTGANEMVFDDSTGQVGLRLGSTTARTGLSLGHIATPRKDGKAVPRGTGAELLTDGAAALRAAQGVLISTHAAASGAPHLHHDDLTYLLTRCTELTRALSDAITHAGGTATSQDGQAAVGTALDTWPGTRAAASDAPSAPLLVVHGRDGVVSATPASHVMYAGRHIDVAADGNVHIASGDRTQFSAAQGTTLHACNGGIDIGADHGAIRLRADDAEAHVDARQAVRITSHDDEIVLSGRAIRIVAADGSYLRIGDGIELGTSKTFLVHADAPLYEGAKTMPPPGPGRPTEGTRQQVRVHYYDIDRASRTPAVGHAYESRLSDGSLVTGRTDADGLTEWLTSATTDISRVALHRHDDDADSPAHDGAEA